MLTTVNLSWLYTWQVALIGILAYAPTFVLTPRFVLRLRDLYARDLRGRCGSDIDTAFGLTSYGYAAVASRIVFAECKQNMGKEQGEERDDEQGEGRDEGRDEGQDAGQDEEIQMVDRAVRADTGGSV